MKNKIRKLIREEITKILKEYEESFMDIVSELPREIMGAIANKEPIRFKLIPKNQYHAALREFIKYGQFIRFPTKYIFKWKNLLLNNIAKLNALTDIHGHSSDFPFDEFYDYFDYNYDTDEEGDGEFSKWCQMKFEETENEEYLKNYNFSAIYEFLYEIYNIDDITPQFSNGHSVLSDFATQPLLELGLELEKNDTPEEIIVTINKILDVAHQRSDIAEIFIEGGSDSLKYISNNE
jgi:hypothetical protein